MIYSVFKEKEKSRIMQFEKKGTKRREGHDLVEGD